jgi:hypothetical protein
MSELSKAMLAANFFRYLLIIPGTMMMYWGYRLFLLGFTEKGGELKAAYGKTYIILKSVAPGVFFAAFGVITISIGVYRGIDIKLPDGSTARMSYRLRANRPCEGASSGTDFYGGKEFTPRKDNSQPPPK